LNDAEYFFAAQKKPSLFSDGSSFLAPDRLARLK
jgi:hypothetical protein